MTEQKPKIPSQFFQWFDSLKQGYENSIHKLFSRVEAVNEDHKKQMTSVYQSQIDDLKVNQTDHIDSLKDNLKTQTAQANNRIRQLEKDAGFYQDQIKSQNNTIEKLNARYDAVIFALKDKMDNKELAHVIKDISPLTPLTPPKASPLTPTKPEQPEPKQDTESKPEAETKSEPEVANDFIQQVSAKMAQSHHNEPEPKPKTTTESAAPTEESTADGQDDDHEKIIEQAFSARKSQNFEQAYELFLAAANLGNEKAMGAIGRAHFIGEGTYLDKPTGLAWLIIAADHDFEPAMQKVASAKIKSPALYQSAFELALTLLSEEPLT
ncbi:MAG: hypothetical protein ACI8WB_005018 [Phenylobacterium sp.]|jgi:hypothetical protein